MLFGLDLSIGWQWVIWWVLAAFVGSFFYMVIVSLWEVVQVYEMAWWNRWKGLWIGIGGVGGLLLGVGMSGSLVSALVKESVVFKGTYQVIRSAFYGNALIFWGVDIVHWAGMSFFLLVAYLGGTPVSKAKRWAARHFNVCLAGIFLLFFALRLLGIYLKTRGN